MCPLRDFTVRSGTRRSGPEKRFVVIYPTCKLSWYFTWDTFMRINYVSLTSSQPDVNATTSSSKQTHSETELDQA